MLAFTLGKVEWHIQTPSIREQIPLLTAQELTLQINFDGSSEQYISLPKDYYMVERSKVIFEDKEIGASMMEDSDSDHEIIEDEEEEGEINKKQAMEVKPFIIFDIRIKSIAVTIDLQYLPYHLAYVSQLDKQFKLILLLVDIIKSIYLSKIDSMKNDKIYFQQNAENDVLISYSMPIILKVALSDMSCLLEDSEYKNKQLQQQIFQKNQ
mmetsp:Transcript_39344/g.37772  ORF Transcript_39344/g.37772 Transcript_39344/m.37772 type:complete len:210 (+) Transcript_39344:1156-1785(+)